MHSWKKSLRNTALAALLSFSSTTVALAAPNVTLNVHDGEVRDVLTAISALSDASIVTDESVRGKITIALDNVPFDTAIKLITSAKGLAYRVVDGVILVSTQENLNKFNGNVNVFKLNYAKAEDVKAALDGLLEGTNKVGTDPITNSILFTGSSTDEDRVRSAIKAMDVATKQITLEAKIIAINKDDTKNLGINWNWDKVWNVPLDEFMQIIDNSLEKGYTISWGTDVSEKGFSRTKGLGIVPEADLEGMQGTEAEKWGKLTQKEKDEALYKFDKPGRERTVTQELRQKGYDNYETTDDHGMQIVGTATDQNGTPYYKVKNSWNTTGPYDGYWYFSRPFVAYKTMTVLVNKNAVPKAILKKIGVK